MLSSLFPYFIFDLFVLANLETGNSHDRFIIIDFGICNAINKTGRLPERATEFTLRFFIGVICVEVSNTLIVFLNCFVG